MAGGQWFSPGTLVSSPNTTDRHNITEILLKVALNTVTLNSLHEKFLKHTTVMAGSDICTSLTCINLSSVTV